MAGAASPGGMPETAVRALQAGCDLLCLGTDNTDEEVAALEEAIAAAIADGRLDSGRVEEAAGRVLDLTEELAASPPPVREPSAARPAPRLAAGRQRSHRGIRRATGCPGLARRTGSCLRRPARDACEHPRRAGALGAVRGDGRRADADSQAVFATQPQYEVSGEDSPLPSPDRGRTDPRRRPRYPSARVRHQRLSTGYAPSTARCWSWTWAGRRTTAATPTSRRSAPRGWPAGRS